MIRSDRRRPDELRPVTIEAGFLKYPEGSALIGVGNTRLICAASIEDIMSLNRVNHTGRNGRKSDGR